MAEGQEFKLLITGDASNYVAAAGQAGEATKKIKVDTSDLNDETKRSLGILPDLKDQIKKSGEASEEAGLSHREFGRVLNEVGNVSVPGLGRSLRELAFGPVGAALALLGAFDMLKKSIDDDSEALDKLGTAASESLLGSAEQVHEAWQKNIEVVDSYFVALKNGGEDKDPIKTQIDNIKALTAAKLESMLVIAKATGESPAQLEAIQHAIDSNAGAGSLQAELQLRTGASVGYETQYLTAQGNADAAAAARQKNIDEQAAIAKALSDKSPEGINGRLDAAAQNLQNAQDIPQFVQVPGEAAVTDNSAVRNAAIKTAQEEQAAVKLEQDNLLKRQSQLASEFQIADLKAKDTAANAERLKSESTENEARRKELGPLITQATAVQNAKESGAAGVAILGTHLGNTNETLHQVLTAVGIAAAQQTNIVQRLLDHTLSTADLWRGIEARVRILEAQGRQVNFNNK